MDQRRLAEPPLGSHERRGDKWTAKAYAWPDKTEKPAEPVLKQDVASLKGQGKCTVWATPCSNTPIYFDDPHIEVEAAAAKEVWQSADQSCLFCHLIDSD